MAGGRRLFLLAAASGALLRIGFVSGLPWGLDAGNLRHAHSHLMSFSWTTPAIMALWLSFGDRLGVMTTRMGRLAAVAALVLGLLTFPFFLLAGYGRVTLFGSALPMSSILSGVTMISWYLFGAWRLRVRRSVRRTHASRLLDVSLIGLGLSTVGAWGRAAIQAAGVGAPELGDLAVQLFLGAFTHGWLVVATLGLAYGCVEAGDGRVAGASPGLGQKETGSAGEGPWPLLLVGLPGASLVGALGASGPRMWVGGELAVGVAALLFCVGLSWYAVRLTRAVVARRLWTWLPFLVYLLVMIVGLGGSSFPALAVWGESIGLRIVYLHVLALGVASTGLITAARERWGSRVAPSPWSFGALTLLLLVGLLSLTPLWPAAASAAWRRSFAAWTSIPPILAIVKSVLPNASLRLGKDRSPTSPLS